MISNDNVNRQKYESGTYYSVLPSFVKYCKALSASEILLYGEIASFCNQYGRCDATNNYFGVRSGAERETISRRISNLKKHGFIRVKINDFHQRHIYITDEGQNLLRGGCDHTVKGCDHTVKGCDHTVKGCDHMVKGCDHMVTPCNNNNIYINNNNNISKEKNIKKKERLEKGKSSFYDDLIQKYFDEFYKAYPKKADRPEAFCAYRSLFRGIACDSSVKRGDFKGKKYRVCCGIRKVEKLNLPLLNALRIEKKRHDIANLYKLFVPPYKNPSTWLRKFCWVGVQSINDYEKECQRSSKYFIELVEKNGLDFAIYKMNQLRKEIWGNEENEN